MKIVGLEKLQGTIKDAQKALEGLDGHLGTVSFDPNDQASIEAAIGEIERVVDERAGPYANNAIIKPLIDGVKEKYREAILEKAVAAGVKGEGAQ